MHNWYTYKEVDIFQCANMLTGLDFLPISQKVSALMALKPKFLLLVIFSIQRACRLPVSPVWGHKVKSPKQDCLMTANFVVSLPEKSIVVLVFEI